MNKLKGIVFIAIFCVLFLTAQYVVQPKWVYPSDIECHGGRIEEFHDLEKDTLDVVFSGTSHMMYGLIPMQLYKERRIVSYNYGLSAHRITPLYYQLQNVFQTQSPKVVMVDVSLLYLNTFLDLPWRRVLDFSSSLSIQKLKAAEQYAIEYYNDTEEKKQEEEEEAAAMEAAKNGIASDAEPDLKEEDEAADSAERVIDMDYVNTMFKIELGALLPFYRYHVRGTDLNVNDFSKDALREYYSKGFVASTYKGIVWGTKASVNKVLDNIMSKDTSMEYRQVNGKEEVVRSEKDPYRGMPDDEQIEWLHRIQSLCEANGAQLQLVKIPVISNSRDYESAWTKLRSRNVHKIANDMGVNFLDLVYDVNIGIDTENDFRDNGMHLNFYGAKKVTAFLGNYLETVCGVKGGSDKYYNRSLLMYEKLDEAAQIQESLVYKTYMKTLKQNLIGKTILLSVRGVQGGLFTEKEMNRLYDLGVLNTFDKRYFGERSYIGIIRNGKSVYEAAGEFPVETIFKLDGDHMAEMTSIGSSVTNSRNTNSSIKIDGVEYSQNKLGLNIVVYDNVTGTVIDQIVFSRPNAEEKLKGERNYSVTDQAIRKYEYKMYEDFYTRSNN